MATVVQSFPQFRQYTPATTFLENHQPPHSLVFCMETTGYMDTHGSIRTGHAGTVLVSGPDLHHRFIEGPKNWIMA